MITLVDDHINLNKEKQAKFLQHVTTQCEDMPGTRGKVRKGASPKDQYIAQRARDAYIATVCQPEASLDLSFASQVVGVGAAADALRVPCQE